MIWRSTRPSGVLESFGNGPDDAKPERPPEPHGNEVGFHHGVELHRSVSALARPPERVLAERAPDPPAPCVAPSRARGPRV
jgi:hypothetical protein